MVRVALYRGASDRYPHPPFHPPEIYPELAGVGFRTTDSGNGVYAAVRNTLALLRLDPERYGTPEWNPLGAYIRPGDKVVIKPNLVLHRFGPQLKANCLTTHGSVIRATLDYAYLAAGPEGRISIADAPLQGADFGRVIADAGLSEIQAFYRESLKRDIEVIDLRQVHAVIDEDSSLIRRVEPLAGDPRGYCEIDLGAASRLHPLDSESPRYVVGDYDDTATNLRHGSTRHSYVVSRTVLDADAILCVPKLKTHSKTGLTVCLKNMVGIIGSKDCLPHHRFGKSDQGGDEFANDYPMRWHLSGRAHDLLQGRVPVPVWRAMRRLGTSLLGAGTPQNGAGQRSSFYPSGGWHGNDTIWRTVDDLNRIVRFYSPTKGAMQSELQRRYFAVVDGITAMEGNGPLRGTPKATGLILGGDDPLAIDVTAAALMGFDWRQIRMLDGISNAMYRPRYSAFEEDSSLQVCSNVPPWNSLDDLRRDHFGFLPPNGWKQSVELTHVG